MALSPQTNRSASTRTLTAFVLPLASLVVGTSLSLLLTNPSAGDTLSSPFDTLLAVSLWALVTSLAPLVALTVGALTFPSGSGNGYTAILVPSLLLAAVGIIQECAGTGRLGWWVAPLVDADGVGWITRVAGQVGGDVLACASGIALAEVARSQTRSDGEGGVRLGEGDAAGAGDDERRQSLRRPLRLLALAMVLVLAGPLLPSSAYNPSHPAPDHPRYTYSPLKVACVVPPSLLARRGAEPQTPSLDDWLAESRIVAGRGAKVLSWSEGAVRLEKGARQVPDDGEDEEMGADEAALLAKVGEVCDMYKVRHSSPESGVAPAHARPQVYILATYVVPPASASHRHDHKYLNVATLVGPGASSSAPGPHIVWTTTKQRPVPFVESFSHTLRSIPSLGSQPGALPLAEVQLPHGSRTPSPHLTPQQRVSVSGAICQDIAFPSLVSSYVVPSSDDSNPHRRRPAAPPRTPQLLLNPSLVPASLPGLARASLAQVRARALEHGAFVLRCAGAGGGDSALVGPEGDVRVLQRGDERGGSWEAEVGVERARATRGGTWWEWVGGTTRGGWFGGEGRWWLVLAAGVALVRLVEGGEAGSWLSDVEWAGLRTRMGERMREERRRIAGVLSREREEGAREDGRTPEARLIDVE